MTSKDVELPDIRQWSATVLQTEHEDGSLEVQLADIPELRGLNPKYEIGGWPFPIGTVSGNKRICRCPAGTVKNGVVGEWEGPRFQGLVELSAFEAE